MYQQADRDEILRLAKVAVATQADMDSIYELFKKYVRPNAAMYQVSCSCSTSISRYYQLLIEWYSENADKFNITNNESRKRNNKK